MYWASRAPRVCRYVVPNGVFLRDIDDAPAVVPGYTGLSPTYRAILCVGRFSEEKNIPNLLLAIREVMEEQPLIALFCGDGYLRSAVEQRIVELGIEERVRLLGNVPDVWSLMKRAEIVACVSHFEGFPNVVLEAMACGCPLVVSDIPAHREILDERMALFADPDKPQDIAAALRRALATPEEMRMRASAAKEKAAEWSVSFMARQYERVYRESLGL